MYLYVNTEVAEIEFIPSINKSTFFSVFLIFGRVKNLSDLPILPRVFFSFTNGGTTSRHFAKFSKALGTSLPIQNQDIFSC